MSWEVVNPEAAGWGWGLPHINEEAGHVGFATWLCDLGPVTLPPSLTLLRNMMGMIRLS